MSYNTRLYKEYQEGLLSKQEYNCLLSRYRRAKDKLDNGIITMTQYRQMILSKILKKNQCQRCTVLTGEKHIFKKLHTHNGKRLCLSCLKDVCQN